MQLILLNDELERTEEERETEEKEKGFTLRRGTHLLATITNDC